MGVRQWCPSTRSSLVVLLAIASSAASVQAVLAPFYPVETARPQAIAKRQGCIDNFYSCAGRGDGFNGVCCQNGQTCELDESNSPACCPANAVCTGTAPASFVPPSPTQRPALSFVENPFFPFPYAATYFYNRADCSSAVRQCDANFDACTAQLPTQTAGAGFGVTIVVPGMDGGTTITGGVAVSVDAASATSICSSLSTVACRGLEMDMCTMTGTYVDGFYFGTGNAAARPTPPPCARAVAGAVAAGLAGLAVANAL